MALRNESPPPDDMDEDVAFDIINDTAFSKIGFINLVKTILIKLEEYCDIESKKDFENDLEFDDDVCKLMDMTVEPGVLYYTADIPLIDPLCEAICINKSDRLNEIFIGIIANFASNDLLCQQLSKNCDLVNLLVSFWSSPNSSFLIECVRLLKMILRNKECSPVWINNIKCDEEYLRCVIFILKSSINNELLVSTMQVVSELMARDDELCERWICTEMMSAMLVARNEADWFINNDIDYYHFVLHMFSTHENGIVYLISNISAIYSDFCDYLDKICDEESNLIMIGHYHNSLRLILPTIDVIVSNMAEREALAVLQSRPSMLTNLVRLVHSCCLQSDDALVQEIDLEISAFFTTIIRISHAILETSAGGATDIKWLQSIDKGACLPQLQAFLGSCTRDVATKVKLTDITLRLNLTYLHEALTDDNNK